MCSANCCCDECGNPPTGPLEDPEQGKYTDLYLSPVYTDIERQFFAGLISPVEFSVHVLALADQYGITWRK